MRKTLITLLEREEDFLVRGQAASGEEALERLADADLDLLLIDISLPGMDGLTLLHKVQARWPKLPCVILSGHDESIYGAAAQAAGARAYIDKRHVREIVPTIRRTVADARKGGY